MGGAPPAAMAQTQAGTLPSHVMVLGDTGAEAAAPRSLPAADQQRLRDAHLRTSESQSYATTGAARSSVVTSPNGISITINYSNGPVFGDSGARAAFERAVETWARHILLEEDIVVSVSSADLGDSILGSMSMGSTTTVESIIYPTPIDGVTYSGPTFSLTFNDFDSGDLGGGGPWRPADPFYFGANPDNIPSDQVDFESIALHLLGHGLGIDAKMYAENGKGYFFSSSLGEEYTLYGSFIKTLSGNTLIDTYDSGSEALGGLLTGTSTLFFSGPVVNFVESLLAAQNTAGGVQGEAGDVARTVGGNPGGVELFDPGDWRDGISIMHFDEATYNFTQDGLMTPYLDVGEIRRDLGPLTCAVFADLGREVGRTLAMGPECKIARGGITYVDRDATGANNGSSWDDAYTSVQQALTVIDGNDDEIWIAEGTYTPGDQRSDSFTLTGAHDGVKIYGGFEGTEHSRDQRDPSRHVTILSGDIDGDGSLSGNSYHVLTLDGGAASGTITGATVLDGLTIAGGNADGTGTNGYGGGLHCNGTGAGSACSPTLQGLVFSGNYAGAEGGAIANNADADGTSSPTITNTVFVDNRSGFSGGAISNITFGGESSPTIIGSVFTGNEADANGGAIKNGAGYSASGGGTASPTIVNATFHGNSAQGDGGALFSGATNGLDGEASAPEVVNSIFAGNQADSDGNGAGTGDAVHSTGSDAVTTIRYALFADGAAGAAVSNGGTTAFTDAGGTPVGFAASTSFQADPQLTSSADPDGADNAFATPDDGLRLGVGSGAIDRGTSVSVLGEEDVTGAPRAQGATVDVGAYEGTYVPGVIYVNEDAPAGGDGAAWATAYQRLSPALERAGGSDEIWIAEGTYTPGDDRAESFVITGDQDGLEVYGGFAGTETRRVERHATPYQTILSGDIDGDGTAAGNSYHVVLMDGQVGLSSGPITPATVLSGVTIRGGTANGPFEEGHAVGGGLYCKSNEQGDCSPTLTDIAFAHNRASSGGAFHGGNSPGEALVGRTTGPSSPVITNALFVQNEALGGEGIGNTGGALHVTPGSALVLRNATLVDNHAEEGGGLSVGGGDSTPFVANTIFYGNTATGSGDQFYANGSGTTTLTHTLVEGGASGLAVAGGGSVTYIGADGAPAGDFPSSTNLQGDPRFDDTATPAGADGLFATNDDGLRPVALSPVIDAGDNDEAPVESSLDLTSAERIQGGTINLGAYEIIADRAITLHVDADAPSGGDGTTWASAFPTLQGALDVATANDEIWVAAGTYTPSALRTPSRPRTASFIISGTQDGLEIYGGFDGTDGEGGGAREAERSARAPDANLVILSGDIGTEGEVGDNARNVLFLDGTVGENGITSATVLDGLTVADGYAERVTGIGAGYPINDGAGLYCDGSGDGSTCSPMLRQLVFRDNAASSTGAVYNDGSSGGESSPLITNVHFEENTALSWAGNAGALQNYATRGGESSPILTNVTFVNNTATVTGGALANRARSGGTTSPTITNAVFYANSAGGGGAMQNAAIDDGSVAHPVITNTTFTGNTGGEAGGVLNITDAYGGTSQPELRNVILWDNSAPEVYINGGSATVTDGLIEGGCPSGVTCTALLTGDPLLSDTSDADGPDDRFGTADDGLRLGLGSPAINVGDNDALPPDWGDADGDNGGGDGISIIEDIDVDITGAARIQNGTVNLGAYEVIADEAKTIYVDADAPSGGDGTAWASAFTHLQDALAAATGNDEIWVAGGTYVPDAGAGQTPGARESTFRLTGQQDGLAIYGGFAGSESSPEERTLSAHETVLSGDLDQDETLSGNSYHVLVLDGSTTAGPITRATVVRDVTITGGNADTDGSYRDTGGGVLCQGHGSGSVCSPTLQHIIFENNAAKFGGGALFVNGRSGGEANPRIVGSVFVGNTVEVNGGAVYNYGRDGESSPQFTNVTFEGNRSGASGGAMFSYSYTDGIAHPTLTNTILHGNESDSNGNDTGTGDQLYNTGTEAGPTLRYTLVEGGAAGVMDQEGASTLYEDANGEAVAFENSTNLDADPLFSDARTPAGPDGQFGTVDDGLHVTDGSPVLDAGTPDTTGRGLAGADLTGELRIVDNDSEADTPAVVDLGAYEGRPGTLLPVELAGFTAAARPDAVALSWQTTSETGNAGFHVQRAAPAGWVEVGFVNSQAEGGTTSRALSYQFEDTDLPYAADSLTYRLQQVDTDGTTSLSEAVTIARGAVTRLELLGTYPNPARSRATVRFAIPTGTAKQDVSLRLYDVLGREVRSVRTAVDEGRHEVQLSTGGLSSGVYFLRLRAGGTIKTRKLTVVQ